MIKTPALIYSEQALLDAVDALPPKSAPYKLLYSLKACALHGVVEILANHIDGFSCSSQYESRAARGCLRADQTVHLFSPGFKPAEVAAMCEYVDYVTFNSVKQLYNCQPLLSRETSVGIRIDPQISFVADRRYDPSARISKLGVPLNALAELSKSGGTSRLSGLLVHNNCESTDLAELLTTVQCIRDVAPWLLDDLEWINLGGGYVFEGQNYDAFHEAVYLLAECHDLTVFIEPGLSLVGDAGRMVTEVVDVFERNGRAFAVLDTTVNHIPEVFEYQYSPRVVSARQAGEFSYVVAGCSCLPGDIFGEYSFDTPLLIGSRVTFSGVGAYAFVKSHMFNGISLPTVYLERVGGGLTTLREFGYSDFAFRNGAPSNAVV